MIWRIAKIGDKYQSAWKKEKKCHKLKGYEKCPNSIILAIVVAKVETLSF